MYSWWLGGRDRLHPGREVGIIVSESRTALLSTWIHRTFHTIMKVLLCHKILTESLDKHQAFFLLCCKSLEHSPCIQTRTSESLWCEQCRAEGQYWRASNPSVERLERVKQDVTSITDKKVPPLNLLSKLFKKQNKTKHFKSSRLGFLLLEMNLFWKNIWNDRGPLWF